ncbi:Ig-like domain-containing protein [Microbacterium sp. CPCC 204701]|uniref:Ig-like domain-containing protein n=1 Tax=Microbacterium sp. CPCC 204701 TaxID=2493084 RepID=UPI00197C2ADB|nr:Ig-like domain-containing protein [Microbacterium sp. CPCC 204701]
MLQPVADLDALVPDAITGTGVPGAAVVLIDELGATLTQTTVDPDGTFIADIPADLLREGMSVRAVQTAPALLESPPSAAVGPFTLPAPVVTAGNGTPASELETADTVGVDNDLSLLLDGLAGETVVVWVDGVTSGIRHELIGAPLSRFVFNTNPGEHVIGIRYVDPITGRLGRLAEFTITALPPQPTEPIAPPLAPPLG